MIVVELAVEVIVGAKDPEGLQKGGRVGTGVGAVDIIA